MLLEELVEGDPEVDPLAGRHRHRLVLNSGDGRRERVADHLHVRVRGADGVVGSFPVTRSLRVDDGLGLENVVGHQSGDGILGQPGGAARNALNSGT